MRIPYRFLLAVLLVLGLPRLSFAQDEFYNRDSSGYTYRIGPVSRVMSRVKFYL